jgi:hypothetical protein
MVWARLKRLAPLILRMALRYWIEAAAWAAPAFGMAVAPHTLSARDADFDQVGIAPPANARADNIGTSGNCPPPGVEELPPGHPGRLGRATPLSREERRQWAAMVKRLG